VATETSKTEKVTRTELLTQIQTKTPEANSKMTQRIACSSYKRAALMEKNPMIFNKIFQLSKL
jgi:hypothetical protein